MAYEIEVKSKAVAKFLSLAVAVRYDEEDMPKDAPLRSGDMWIATINLDEQKIVNWPQGKTLSFYMKITDQGTYTLLDADGKELVTLEDAYVPNNLLPGEYGDYLELEIDETGKITNWLSDANLENFEVQP